MAISTRPQAYSTPTQHHSRRPRTRAAVALVLAVLVLSVITFWAVLRPGHPGQAGVSSPIPVQLAGAWPAEGQAAIQVEGSAVQASPDERPAPIASVAKVMTAYLILKDVPLADDQDGPTLAVTSKDVADTSMRNKRGESIVAVRAGERLTERQALQALLLPSANNIAILLARWHSGSVDAFVTRMNTAAHHLGMKDTTYTDPSGFDPGTVSTAQDQVLLAQAAMKDDALASLVELDHAELPVAGTVRNTDTLLGKRGFVGVKTGSDDAAGGCFMFRTYRIVDGAIVAVTGVVLGQRGHDLIGAALGAAEALADQASAEVPRA